jgi:hypothetical protein
MPTNSKADIFFPGEVDCSDETLSRLRSELDRVCEEIAKKFNLFDARGRPKKSFIVDTLMRNICPACAIKQLTQLHEEDNIDALYREGHGLALNIFVETLRYELKRNGLNAVVEGEVAGDYGRLDVIIRLVNQGIMLEFKDASIIIELKTGASISLIQLLRYGMEYPNSIIVVWRIRMKQFFMIDMRRHGRILFAIMFAALNRGLAILNGAFTECHHNNRGNQNKASRMENPQQLVDELFSSLSSDLPSVLEMILRLAGEKFRASET